MKATMSLIVLLLFSIVCQAQTIEETLAQIEATKLELAQNEQLVEQKSRNCGNRIRCSRRRTLSNRILNIWPGSARPRPSLNASAISIWMKFECAWTSYAR